MYSVEEQKQLGVYIRKKFYHKINRIIKIWICLILSLSQVII